MLSIDDECSQADLCKHIRIADGQAVAKLSSDMVTSGRAVLVRRACLECVAMCSPTHAKAIVDYFVSSQRSGAAGRRALADVLATIMHGARKGYSAVEPTGTARASVNAILDMPGADDVLPNLRKLPARLGPTWLGLVALARDAVRTGASQEPLVSNPKLQALYEGRDPRVSSHHDDAEMQSLKMCALWVYSREAPMSHTSEPSTHPVPAAPRVVACEAMPAVPPDNAFTCILDAE